MAKVYAVVPAAGRGTRMAGANKQLVPLSGVPVLIRSLLALEQLLQVEGIVLVAPADSLLDYREAACKWGVKKIIALVAGGTDRQQSVLNGLLAVPSGCGVVIVHDGARPLVTRKEIEDLISAAGRYGAATLAVPVKDTVKETGAGGFVAGTPDRSRLWLTQTPQGFFYDLLVQAHRLARDRGRSYTDDASLVEDAGHRVKIVEGRYSNIKITTPEDLLVAGALLSLSGIAEGREAGARIQEENKHLCSSRQGAAELRVGFGYDAHRLVSGRKLILGGVEIPYEKGLEGHSDADVLTHAIMDALLGAAGMGDIGRHFPDTEPHYKGITSLLLLGEVRVKLDVLGFAVQNVDSTIVAQAPRLAGHVRAMRENLAGALGVDDSRINVKATTTEGLGFTGAKDGIASYAVALIRAKPGKTLLE